MLWGNVQVERLKANIDAMDREQRRRAGLGLERWRKAFKPVVQALEVSQTAETHLTPTDGMLKHTRKSLGTTPPPSP